MTDINFDELDKAVNSVLEGDDAKPGDKAKGDDPDKPVSSADTPAKVSVAESEKPNPVTSSEPKKTEVKAPEPGKKPAAPASSPIDKGRRSGMFMDVVHPGVTKKPELIAKGSKTLKPLSSDVKPEPLKEESKPKEQPEPAEVEPNVNEASKPEEPKVAAQAPVASEAQADEKPGADQVEPGLAGGQSWPDPLDVHGFKYDENKSKDEDRPAEAAETVADDSQEEPKGQEASPAEPPTTPFLSDAKVEKRPLGAFAAPGQEDEAQATDKPATPGGQAEGAPEPPTDNQNPPVIPEKLPPELSDEVLAVEGGEFNDAKAARDKEPESDTHEEEAGKQEAKEAESQPSAPVVSASGSIPQQYHEQPSENRDDPHNMLVTQDHQTPLLEPPHHGKHAALWITLAIIILIATGAGFAWWFLIATA